MLNAITLFRIGWQEYVRGYIIDDGEVLLQKKNFSISSYLEKFSFVRKVIREARIYERLQ